MCDENPTIANNIIYQAETITTPFIYIRSFFHDSLGRIDALSEMSLLMNNNIYYKKSGNFYFEDVRPLYEN